jgi:hypothetical protein
MWFIPGLESYFTIWKSINIINHINKLGQLSSSADLGKVWPILPRFIFIYRLNRGWTTVTMGQERNKNSPRWNYLLCGIIMFIAIFAIFA